MQKFEYNGKNYIKIKQDWYTEIGSKVPLKTAVTLDSLFNAKLIENEQSIVKLLDQTRYYLSIGSPTRAHEVIVEALSLATHNEEKTQFLPSVLIMYAHVVNAVEKYQEGIDTFEKVMSEEALGDNPQVVSALANLYLNIKNPEKALELAQIAMAAFKKSKRKVSDELMIVWSQLKKEFPETYQIYRDQVKQTKQAKK